MPNPTPIASEFTTTFEAEAHDAWARSKVERALASKLPAVPHDQVMAEVLDIINAKRHLSRKQVRGGVEGGVTAGEIVAEGTPERVVKAETGSACAKVL
jgi:hypothetical protein